jgi:hypothetical protein
MARISISARGAFMEKLRIDEWGSFVQDPGGLVIS